MIKMKQYNLYLREDDGSLQAFNKLKDFGMDMQTVLRKALIKKAKELTA